MHSFFFAPLFYFLSNPVFLFSLTNYTDKDLTDDEEDDDDDENIVEEDTIKDPCLLIEDLLTKLIELVII